MNTTEKTIRPDIMQVVTMSDNAAGRAQVRKIKGSARIVVTKAFNEPTSEICVETSAGFSPRVQREQVLLNITFKDRSVWSGSFDDLQKHLKAFPIVTNMVNASVNNDPSSTYEYMTEAFNLVNGK